MREMDGQELKRMNGKEGNPVYVGFQGKVYDVTESSLWNTGVHMARHAAGQDLTAEMEAAPHGPEVLDKFPQVGILKKSGPSAHVKPLPSFLQKAFDRYPLLRRQPHPMTVHFPIAFLMAPFSRPLRLNPKQFIRDHGLLYALFGALGLRSRDCYGVLCLVG